MNAPEPGDAQGPDSETLTNGGRHHLAGSTGVGATHSIEVPTYGLDGQRQLMMPVEIDGQDAPPRTVELLGCDTAGRPVLRHYIRERDEAGGAYVHATRRIGNFR
jgi:hypothetical protein